MRPFSYVQAASLADAARLGDSGGPTAFLAGGTTLLDLMKLDVMQPERLIDITKLGADLSGEISARDGTLRLGALARMSDAAEHEAVRRDFPVIADTLKLGASQQIRNMARLGGNLLQRTRCPYFRDTSWAACNKRNPGSGCAALEGFNRLHAVLGTSDACVASYPGDFAQALMALDATLEIVSATDRRTLPIAALHVQPGTTPERETSLTRGEVITNIIVPAGPWTRRSLYLKVRDRESYAFALASAAVALDLRDGAVSEARIALGGVASVPWRASAAEQALKGRKLDEESARAAAKAAFEGARPLKNNAFKVELGQRTLVRALLTAAKMEVT
jgi:xanthine dehydrogenase YagS FAD-binding subunit